MKASVIIISYNQGRFLEDAIKSVLGQTLQPKEVILVDDGSTDYSAQIAALYKDKVRWIVTPRLGQVGCFNRGFKEAKGEYIALLEADDIWMPDKLERCVRLLENEPKYSLVQHWLLQINAINDQLPGYRYPLEPHEFSIQDLMKGNIPGTTSSIVFRSDSLRPYLPLPNCLSWGADICLKFIAASLGPIANIPSCLGDRRIHGKNMFGETLYDSPDKIYRALISHDSFSGWQEDHLKKVGLDYDPELRRRLNIERHKMLFFAWRYTHDVFGMMEAFTKTLVASGWRLNTFLKAIALMIAAISPRLYLKLEKTYSKLNWA